MHHKHSVKEVILGTLAVLIGFGMLSAMAFCTYMIGAMFFL